ncbi:endonuclease [Zobellella denitrificans]|uniref:Endonuclease n=1 Tax=Zobellella denitrificans TaxID=347534 RepID=A0A291HUG2_9GAMM|nr:GIY-YIG nuclease family protein [Zobellella denitrificans]ATG75784.1 endonuclease [Zobellella denitrificans]
MNDTDTAEAHGWFVYLLRCRDHSLYAGISLDPERRCREHNQRQSLASRYVWARRPATLAWQQEVADKSTALKLEYRLKQLTRKQKEQLLQDPEDWRQLL